MSTPPIHGLLLRSFRGEADYAGLVALHEASRDHDQVDPFSSLEHVPTLDDIAHSAVLGQEPERGLRVAEVAGSIVGYTSTVWWEETDGQALYLHRGLVQPGWRGRGIGTALLRWAEEHLRQRARQRPAGTRASFAANATSTQQEAHALLQSEGYVVPDGRDSGYVEMGNDDLGRLPAVVLPAGVRRRPVVPAHHRAIYRAMKEAYAEEPDTLPSEEEYRRWARRLSAEPALCFVAWEGEEVAGQVLCRIARGRGEITEVSVRKPWRRRGIATALLVLALETLRDRGLTEARLHTLRNNLYGSIPLYGSVGFRKLKETYWYRKPFSHP
jgi:ribosomal protein S18 acetylase RimI-like enzyme